MDPYSRRFLWNLITSLVQEGRSVILTSHRFALLTTAVAYECKIYLSDLLCEAIQCAMTTLIELIS